MSHPGAAVPFLLLAVLCAVSSSASAQTEARTSAPNILLIQADDLGYGDLSAYGQARFQTPALDRLAREGIRFTQYYAGSSVCAPSRAVLMTGLHTGHAWIRGHGDIPLRPQDTTITEVLHAAGYRTAVIGKWGLGRPGSTGAPERKGFDDSFGFLDHNHAHRQYTDYLWRNGELVETDPERDYVNDLFTREAIGFIEGNDARPMNRCCRSAADSPRCPSTTPGPMRAGAALTTPRVASALSPRRLCRHDHPYGSGYRTPDRAGGGTWYGPSHARPLRQRQRSPPCGRR